MSDAEQEPSPRRRRRQQDRTKLHFQTGLMGWLARFFSAAEKTGDPYEETVILPAFVSLAALFLAEQHRISDVTAVVVSFGSLFLAGAWLGSAWPLSRNLRVVLRGMSVGVLVSIGVATLTNIVADKSQMRSFATSITQAAMMLFWGGHVIVGSIRSIALVPEEDWQQTAPRRAWIGQVVRMTLKIRKLEDATIWQSVAVHALWKLPWLVGLVIAGRAVFGRTPEEWLDLLKRLLP